MSQAIAHVGLLRIDGSRSGPLSGTVAQPTGAGETGLAVREWLGEVDPGESCEIAADIAGCDHLVGSCPMLAQL
jgi:hypothetical protein